MKKDDTKEQRLPKAYQVQEDYEGNACVVFAKSGIQARRVGAQQLNVEFESVDSCRRAPEFDKYRWSKKVPTIALLEAGWWLTCRHTDQRVDIDENPDLYISENDEVFLDFQSYEDHLKEAVLKKIKHLSVIRKTRRKFPFAKKIQFYHGRMQHPETKEYVDCVTFGFPGQKGMVRWSRLFGQLSGRNKLKAGSRLLVC
jgi:hypothetical protein